ncbi:MAG: hypothetical protein JWN14_2108 [Chthonomonadales bacterium]|nr:hypothetical protein [Chthonomonadales bacterium]
MPDTVRALALLKVRLATHPQALHEADGGGVPGIAVRGNPVQIARAESVREQYLRGFGGVAVPVIVRVK